MAPMASQRDFAAAADWRPSICVPCSWTAPVLWYPQENSLFATSGSVSRSHLTFLQSMSALSNPPLALHVMVLTRPPAARGVVVNPCRQVTVTLSPKYTLAVLYLALAMVGNCWQTTRRHCLTLAMRPVFSHFTVKLVCPSLLPSREYPLLQVYWLVCPKCITMGPAPLVAWDTVGASPQVMGWQLVALLENVLFAWQPMSNAVAPVTEPSTVNPGWHL
mmetsp:Transcript_8337/g.20577  ORF Transcript_8337/g.20577 Transcript_8337/m.20577 type:complete len:219 (+) Transcript_8337:7379-8035(+)